MARTEPKSRRKTWGQLPPHIAHHGFVADLLTGITTAAMDCAVTCFKKNTDYYIAVRVPTESELAEMDRLTAEETAVPYIAGFTLDRPEGGDLYFELGEQAIGSVIDGEGRAVDAAWDEAYEYFRHANQLPIPEVGHLEEAERLAFQRGYAGKGIK